jgi:transcriptional regulator with XRE-family HTH domain
MIISEIQFVSKRQIRAARALLGWTQEELARSARVSVVSVKRLEARRDDRISIGLTMVEKIVSCMEDVGIDFTAYPHGGLGVRLLHVWRAPPREGSATAE